ncbi:AI-2E family transporter [Gemmata obscuriglobus]|uniref:AI-2E family transporter n=2 Tax=Gemmata obscuriglobus TaxID=114 RepID=A0A2Z3H623_9BACT|nr:AI-2E family transporter [Gemmata obscuriglobus]
MGSGTFRRRVLTVAGVAALVATVAAAFVVASDVFFLIFLAVLLAVLLRGATDALARCTGLGAGWALGLVVIAAVAALTTGLYALGVSVAGQFGQLPEEVPRAIDRSRTYLERHEWGRWVLDQVTPLGQLPSGGSRLAGRLASFFSTTFGALGNLVLLTFLALYLAADPHTYLGGAVALIPPRHRRRAEQVLRAIGFHLRRWLLGRLVAMTTVGVIVSAGLWGVGVPQFVVLGLLAAVLTAVPFIGPIAAAVPGVALALAHGPPAGLGAVGVYVLAQAVENYVVTPLVQKRAAQLPPALALAAVALAGVLFGVLGLIAASPLLVAVLVAVKMLYVEDVLGDRLDVPGAAT